MPYTHNANSMFMPIHVPLMLPSILRNLGKASQQWLNEIGITTLEDLQSSGVVDAYMRLKLRYPDKITLNMLYGLYGAVHDVDWRDIPPEIKAELRAEVEM
jgi:DNA transformation protein